MSSHVRCDVHQHKCFAWGLPTQTDADMVHKSLTWDDLAGHAFYRQWLLHGGRAHGQPLYQAQAGHHPDQACLFERHGPVPVLAQGMHAQGIMQSTVNAYKACMHKA
eukprot:1161983-Pelagomonas_calceolata.AAC.2